MPNGLRHVSFERKCAHYAAKKTGPLKWLMQWDIVDLYRPYENVIHAEKTTGQYATNQIYCLRLKVCGGEQRARVIIFEKAKYLLRCSVQDYIESTS
ncbi:hypothetical protein H5410_017271, partial [Solanum commersonii]